MTLRYYGSGVVLILLMVALVGLLLIASRGRARNFLDPEGPVFAGPLPHPAGAARVRLRTPGRFSVVSFNVHYGYATNDIAPTLRANGMAEADVFLLQESNERTAREVAAALGLAWVYYPATIHPTSKDYFGVAILSRWPIAAHRKILLPDHSYFDAARKVAMAAVVDIAGVPIRVVNVHLQSGMLARGYRHQLQELLKCAIENVCEGDAKPVILPATGAVVMGGDFNSWNGGLREALVATMTGASLKRLDGIEGTFSKVPGESGPTRTFDHFFVTPGIYSGPGRVGTVRTGSDHYPIEAVLRLP